MLDISQQEATAILIHRECAQIIMAISLPVKSYSDAQEKLLMAIV